MRRAIVVISCLFIALGCNRKPTPTPEAQPKTAQKPVKQPMVLPKIPGYPSPETWEHASADQKSRANRSFGELSKRKVPVYPGPLFVDDETKANIQSAQDVARRALVLWAVELRAEGVEQAEARGIIDNLKLWKYVSPNEMRFLDNKATSRDESQKLVWRLESMWVLMWALGHIDELKWPGGMCDVKKLAKLMVEFEDDPSFIRNAKLRPAKELLDAQDLTMRIHWAIRDAMLQRGGKVPDKLDWIGRPTLVPVTQSAAVGVVEERHYVLNWLLKSPEPRAWDDVETPT